MALTRHPDKITVHDVGVTLAMPHDMTPDRLEEMTFEVERVLYGTTCGEAFSIAVACTFDPPGIEIGLSIPAVSASLVNRRVSEVLGHLEKAFETNLELQGQRMEISS